jgi:PAS domain S-box-containing protein
MVNEGGVLARFFDCAPMGLGIVELLDDDFIYHSVNEAAAASCNLTPSEMSGKKATEVGLGQDMIELFLAQARQTRISKSSVRFEYLRTVNEVQRSRRMTITPVDGHDSGSPYFCFILEDVTEDVRRELESKQAQEAVATSQRMFSSLVSNIPGVIFRARGDQNWEIEFLSDSVESLLGFKAEEFQGDQGIRFVDLVHPEDYNIILGAAQEACNSIGSYKVEYRISRKGGEMLWVEEGGRVTINEETGALYLDGAMFDITDRKKSEQALLSSERRFRDIISNTDGFIWEIDWDNCYTFVSERVRDILGYEPEEMVGRHVDMLLDPVEQEQIYEAYLRQIRETRGFKNVVHRAIKKSGETAWVDFSGDCVYDSEGNPCGWRGVAHDVTEKRRHEEEIRRLALVAQQTQYAVSMADPGGHLTWVNDGWCRITGYSFDESIGKLPGELVHGPETDHTVDARIAEALAQEKPIECEILNYRKDGTPYWAWTSITPLRDESDALTAYIAIESDITQRKAEQEELQLSESRLAEAQKLAHIGSSVYDVVQRISNWSEETFRIYGWDLESEPPTDQQYSELIHQDDYPILQSKIDTAISFGQPFECDVRLRAQTHEDTRYVHIKAAPEFDSQGKTLRIVNTVHDVTDRRRVVEELIEAREAAMEASQLKSEFLANMSHEIRTPMNGVIGMTELLLGTEMCEEQKDYATTILDSADALMHIIDDILDFSKIEAGKLSVEVSEIDIKQIIEESGSLFAKKAYEKNLELLIDLPYDIPARRFGDAVRIRQILANLISNAIKFTDHGEIVVRAEQSSARTGDEWIRISVRDSGIGIPSERHAAIFDSFTQADGSTTRRYGGTGLGLAIVRQLAQLMGGFVGMDSTDGKGSCFWVELPLEVEADGEPTRESIPLPTLRGTRVLIVDDNETNRKMLLKLFSNWGLVPEEVSGPKEALTILESGKEYDVLVLDCQMPDMDGLQLAQAIQKKAMEPNPTIIMLSSVGEIISYREMRNSGISLCLTKPVRQSILYNAFLEVLKVVDGAEPQNARSTTQYQDFAVSILLAEDNMINRKVATRMFERHGCDVDVAENGRIAYELALSKQYDLIFMDLQMPVMDGFEATLAIRAAEEESGRHTPIIALTAHAMSGDREKCLAIGMDDYISKPIRRDEMLRVLNGVTAAGKAETKKAEPASAHAQDDDAFFKEILGDYIGDADAAIEQLENLLAENRLEEVSKIAHSLKGMSSSVGSTLVSAAWAKVETMAKAGLDVAGLFADAVTSTRKFQESARAFLSSEAA